MSAGRSRDLQDRERMEVLEVVEKIKGGNRKSFTKTPEELKKLLIKKRASIKKLEEESVKILSDLRNICPHEKVSKHCHHFNGSYNDQAYSEYWDECECCGTRLNETTKQHSWYG